MSPGDRREVVVVGAGPAGAVVARGLAAAGCDVLLVERRAWPRSKVCGACLSPGTLRALEAAGLGRLARDEGSVPLRALRLAGWGREARLGLRGSVALSRRALDDALVRAARAAGADFLPGCTAGVGDVSTTGRDVRLRTRDGVRTVRAAVVIATDGLAAGYASGRGAEGPALVRSKPSRVGVGAELDHTGPRYGAGTIHMAVGDAGYVGLVRLETSRLNVAAALDPAAVRRASGPGPVVDGILRTAGFAPLRAGRPIRWEGTPSLTRRPSVPGAERVLAVGDAAGYMEPFTGEGMAWAVGGALALVPIAAEAARAWRPELLAAWTHEHGRRIARSQRLCAALAGGLRRPALARLALAALAAWPALADPFVRRVAGGPALPVAAG